MTGTMPGAPDRIRPWFSPALAMVLLMLAGQPLQAAVNDGLPVNVCFDNRCSPPQARIWERFQAGHGLDAAAIGGLHAGRCFAFGEHLNPDRSHWGGFLIDGLDGDVWFDGRFSFFEQSPDYLSWSIPDARRKWPARRPMQLRSRYAYADIADSWIPVRYWFRRAPASSNLLLVSYFGFEMTILCELKRLR